MPRKIVDSIPPGPPHPSLTSMLGSWWWRWR